MKKIILIFQASFALIISVAAQTPYKIVGTGVTVCYNNTSVITCPTNTTDAFYGQDQGLTPSYQDNGNGTVTDLNTGLMWIQDRGTKISWDSTFIMAVQCTTGGHNDWRVPTIKELYSLINFNGKSAPTSDMCLAYIDTNFFGWTTGDTAIGERVIDAQDWSATQYTSFTMNGDTTIFGVNFVDGRIKGYPKYGPPTFDPYHLYVRYVRGNTNYGINDFDDNGDSTITDNATGLMWAKYDDGAGMNWQNALAYAQTMNTQNYLGYNDWRLPHAKELQSIVDYSRSLDATSSAAIDPVFNCTSITNEGGNTDYPWYWTCTTHLDNMYGVYVTFGEALGYMKMPPSSTYYSLIDVHGAGAQRSDPKSGSVTSYYLGTDQSGNPVYGQGPQGDVIRINNYVRLVRSIGPTNINEYKEDDIFDIYPNPASGNFILSFRENYSQVKIEIFDVLGGKIKEIDASGNSETGIDISELSNGIYNVMVDLGQSGTFNKKIIVVK
jgi:hypothetical protein